MFLLSDPPQEVRPRLYAHDMLLHSPERPAIFTDSESVAADPELDQLRDIDQMEFDAVIGNPPYGARKPAFKTKVYGRLYGPSQAELKAGSWAQATGTRTGCSSPTASSASEKAGGSA